jgi:plastocyanin
MSAAGAGHRQGVLPAGCGRVLRAALLAAAAVAAVGVAGDGLAADPAIHTVTIKLVMYAPSTLTVNRGDTIVWKNEDLVPHTVTADHGAFDSGSIAPGQSWRYVVRRAGDYAYHCTFHPNMHGTLHVR